MENNFRIILAKKRKTGISKSTLTNFYYERTENPELQTIVKVADFLNVSVDELIGRSNSEAK